MPGLVTRNPEELEWPAFERCCFEVKAVSGRHRDPEPGTTSMIACFGDTATAETTPDLVPVDDEGARATADHPYFDWGYVCPSAEAYREGLLETVADAAAVSADVRLDEVGFPRNEFCRCERCERAFAASEHDDWRDWRASLIADFVAAARERVPGDLLVTLYPDPYPGHLRERSGLDPDLLAPHVDEFVVPLYDTAYGTTYWLESLAAGFRDELAVPFAVELYAAEVEVGPLADAYEVARAYADDVFFGYGSANARAVLRRLDAESREGKSFGPEE
jgi:hypothetical protein